jgi:hypothetical protein
MDCGKVCMSESKAKAHALVSTCYSRAYYCPGCRCWHTTSEPLAGRHIQYRSPKIPAK